MSIGPNKAAILEGGLPLRKTGMNSLTPDEGAIRPDARVPGPPSVSVPVIRSVRTRRQNVYHS